MSLAAQIFESNRRRAKRADIALDAQIANREGTCSAIRILNVSADGLMAATALPLCERAVVRIDIPTIGWVQAEIVWVLGDRVGAAFGYPIPQRQFLSFIDLFGASPRG
jgi:hypothetical protein